MTPLAFPENLLRNLRWDPDGCVRFTGGKSSKGYGYVKRDGKMVGVHVAIYELMVGPVPDGLHIDHLCHGPDCTVPADECPHRACCNVGHLTPNTNRENVLRGNGRSALNARKTHCPAGHEYTPENTRILSKGERGCKECRREWNRRYRARKAESR